MILQRASDLGLLDSAHRAAGAGYFDAFQTVDVSQGVGFPSKLIASASKAPVADNIRLHRGVFRARDIRRSAPCRRRRFVPRQPALGVTTFNVDAYRAKNRVYGQTVTY
jgi:hypothetical protein